MDNRNNIIERILYSILFVVLLATIWRNAEQPVYYYSQIDFLLHAEDFIRENGGGQRIGEECSGGDINILVRCEEDTFVLTARCMGDTVKSVWYSLYGYPDLTYQIR